MNKALEGTRGRVRALRGSWVWLALSALASVACSGNEASEVELALASTEQAVQIAYVGSGETTTGRGVHLVRQSSTTRKGKSTGALRITWNNTGAAKISCGVTFISHQYAVTAAHCVPDTEIAINTGTFIVEQYTTTNLDLSRYTAQATVTGSWPNYSRSTVLTANDGYVVTPYTCTVVTRCSYGRSNCPIPGGDVDTALIRCASRPKTGLNWVPVASADSGTQNIEVWWFHEILNLATNADTPYAPYMPNHNWWRYGAYRPNNIPITENYHYWHGGPTTNSQLFPLKSWRSVNGVAYRGRGTHPSYPTLTATNARVCHGTSGSGVFKAGTDEFLGNISIGDVAWTPTLLCSNIGDTSPGSDDRNYSAYVQRSYVAQLQAMSVVQNDRQP